MSGKRLYIRKPRSTMRTQKEKPVISAKEKKRKLLPLSSLTPPKIWNLNPGQDNITERRDSYIPIEDDMSTYDEDRSSKDEEEYTEGENIVETIEKTNGFMEGIKVANGMNLKCIVIESDSETLVSYINKGVPHSHSLYTLIKQCTSPIAQFETTYVIHTLREQNKCADLLANLGHTKPPGLHILQSSPP
ncbi:Ribonuclease H domain [Dillenia turbinata]|uniref:Ribonuclease H domain n=1 Tax=Dillenia turbinata TaxID=194707 RepID=A0AAN8VYK4_9MAGN